MEKLNVILADNQPLTNRGIITVLSQYYHNNIVFETVSSPEEIYALLNPEKFQALILDYELLGLANLSEIETICKKSSSIAILIITTNQEPEDIRSVLDAGISNYILKSCSEAELIDAFAAALSNRKYFSNEILEVLLQKKSAPRQNPEPGKLTPSEIEIVKLITQGYTTKEIASQKNLSFHTIITHRKNIFRKLGISNTSELHMYALRTGLIDSTEYYI